MQHRIAVMAAPWLGNLMPPVAAVPWWGSLREPNPPCPALRAKARKGAAMGLLRSRPSWSWAIRALSTAPSGALAQRLGEPCTTGTDCVRWRPRSAWPGALLSCDRGTPAVAEVHERW